MATQALRTSIDGAIAGCESSEAQPPSDTCILERVSAVEKRVSALEEQRGIRKTPKEGGPEPVTVTNDKRASPQTQPFEIRLPPIPAPTFDCFLAQDLQEAIDALAEFIEDSSVQ